MDLAAIGSFKVCDQLSQSVGVVSRVADNDVAMRAKPAPKATALVTMVELDSHLVVSADLAACRFWTVGLNFLKGSSVVANIKPMLVRLIFGASFFFVSFFMFFIRSLPRSAMTPMFFIINGGRFYKSLRVIALFFLPALKPPLIAREGAVSLLLRRKDTLVLRISLAAFASKFFPVFDPMSVPCCGYFELLFWGKRTFIWHQPCSSRTGVEVRDDELALTGQRHPASYRRTTV
jgi:hypothetical protein